MAHTQSQPSNLFASDITQYSDAELDQYLECNAGCVRVDDPENLPDHFIQRLRVRAGAGHTARSGTIDLNYVSARLVEELVDGDKSPRSLSPGTTVSADDETHERQRQEETRLYNDLVDDGGRPSHPINLGYDIAQNLDEYREILSFWNTSPSDPYAWMVFSRQWCKWKQFREHQQYMRGQGRFSAYCQRLYDRLAKHGYKWSIQLNQEPNRQDKLATWVEFLNYEYWKYDKSAGVVSRWQSRHDEAWEKLVDSKILKPLETEELLWDFKHATQLQGEEYEAQKATSSATSTVDLADQALRKAQFAGLSRQCLAQMEENLSIARSNLAAATKILEQSGIRRKLILEFKKKTKSYSIAKDNASKQSVLLRWILQQVSLIELESKSAEVTETDSPPRNSKHQRSLERNCAEDHKDEPRSKRQRQDYENYALSESKTCASTLRETCPNQRPTQRRTSYTNPSLLASTNCFKKPSVL